MFATVLTFLAEHFELVELLYEAIVNKGLSKDQIKTAIRDAMVAASDAQMQKELGS